MTSNAVPTQITVPASAYAVRRQGLLSTKPKLPMIAAGQGIADQESPAFARGKGLPEGLRSISSPDSSEVIAGAKVLMALGSSDAFSPLLDAAEKEKDPHARKMLLKALCFCSGGAAVTETMRTKIDRLAIAEDSPEAMRQAVFAIYHTSANEFHAQQRVLQVHRFIAYARDAPAATLGAIQETARELGLVSGE